MPLPAASAGLLVPCLPATVLQALGKQEAHVFDFSNGRLSRSSLSHKGIPGQHDDRFHRTAIKGLDSFRKHLDVVGLFLEPISGANADILRHLRDAVLVMSLLTRNIAPEPNLPCRGYAQFWSWVPFAISYSPSSYTILSVTINTT
jgi:hypothetical protein